METAQWTQLDRETIRRQVESVTDSAQSSLGTHYSDFEGSSAYKSDSGERRKTESATDGETSTVRHSSQPEQGDSRGDTIMASNNGTSFTVKEKVIIQEPSEAGDRFKDVALVEGNDNGEKFGFGRAKFKRLRRLRAVNR